VIASGLTLFVAIVVGTILGSGVRLVTAWAEARIERVRKA
jgi:hypothetical protein